MKGRGFAVIIVTIRLKDATSAFSRPFDFKVENDKIEKA